MTTTAASTLTVRRMHTPLLVASCAMAALVLFSLCAMLFDHREIMGESVWLKPMKPLIHPDAETVLALAGLATLCLAGTAAVILPAHRAAADPAITPEQSDPGHALPIATRPV